MHQFGHVYSLQHEMLNPAADDWFRALELWHSAREEGVALNVAHYSNMLRQCVTASPWEASLSVLSKMKEDGIRADATCVAMSLSSCADKGRWREALHVLHHYRDNEKLKLDSQCYLGALRSLKQSGQTERMYAVAADQARSSVPLSQGSYELLLEAAVEEGNEAQTTRIYDAIPSAYRRSPRVKALHASLFNRLDR